MIDRTFLEWFATAMGIIPTGVSLKKTAAELATRNRETGFSPNAVQEHCHDMYTLWSRPHPFFTELRGGYRTGQKRFPHGLKLTPTITKLWYASMGTLVSETGDGRD